jgi:hypothetical protein
MLVLVLVFWEMGLLMGKFHGCQMEGLARYWMRPSRDNLQTPLVLANHNTIKNRINNEHRRWSVNEWFMVSGRAAVGDHTARYCKEHFPILDLSLRCEDVQVVQLEKGLTGSLHEAGNSQLARQNSIKIGKSIEPCKAQRYVDCRRYLQSSCAKDILAINDYIHYVNCIYCIYSCFSSSKH